MANLANIRDVKAARALHNLEAEILRATGHAVIATDPFGVVISWNDAAEALYGWTRDEVLGRNILDITPTSQSSFQATTILHELTRGGTWSGEFEVRHKSGRWFRAHVTNAPVYDEAGDHVAIVGVSIVVEPPKGAWALFHPGTGSTIRNAAERLGLRMPATEHGPRPLHGIFGNRMLEFALALAIFSVGVFARIGLDLIIPGRLPFITFMPAVLLTAYLCGLWPSLFVVLASAVATAVWTDAPPGDIRTYVGAAFVLAGVVGTGVMLLVFHLLKIQDQLRRQDAQLSLINRELKHRLKNVLAVTSSICEQTIRSAAAREEIPRLVSGRIRAVAAAQDLLSITATTGSDLRSLVDAVVGPMAPELLRLRVSGPPLTLPAEATTPFALILHELATNALKYGAWSGPEGRVTIGWEIDGANLDFQWRERGAAPVAPAVREGFGSLLIKRGMDRANVHHDLTPEGLDCGIVLPL